MQYRIRLIGVVLTMVALLLAACSQPTETSTRIEPAVVEPIAGSEFSRVVLTAKAAERLDVQTIALRVEQVDGTQRLVIPYGALIYGLNGETWAYINPEPLTFIRAPITVDYIDGDMVFLSVGPSIGTEVVTVGVAELYGVETGVSK